MSYESIEHQLVQPLQTKQMKPGEPLHQLEHEDQKENETRLGTIPSSHTAAADPLPFAYTDLLLSSNFLLPFISLTVVCLISFGVLRGMCHDGIPGNCKFYASTLLVQQVLLCIERMFLVVAISDMGFLFPQGWRQQRSAILYSIVMHLIAFIAAIVVSAAMEDKRIRAGFGPLRIVVAIIIILILIPPLLYSIIYQYTPRRRLKALCIFIVYLVFLIATGILGGLHVHHWTWSFIYLVLLYPPTTYKSNHPTNDHHSAVTPQAVSMSTLSFPSSSSLHSICIVWSHLASMIALGILIQGMAAYGSMFFYVSSPLGPDEPN